MVTLINLVKGILGTGILAMPEAYMNSGFINGTVFTVAITALITYSLHLLFRGMYVICKNQKIPQLTYPQALKEGLKIGPECLRKFSNSAPYIVNFFIVIYQIGVCCVYIVFIGTNVKQVVDQNTPPESHLSVELYMFILLLPLLAVTYIKNLNWLSPFSFVSNWITLAGLIIIYYYVFRTIEPINERELLAHISKFPLFMGTTMFSILSIGVILSIELNMKEGKYWGGYFGVLNQGMFIVTLLNILTGFGGYWKYGATTEASITLNLSIDEPLSWAVRLLFAIAIFFSYALQCYPATEIIWEQYIEENMEKSEHKVFWEYILRTILVLLTFLLAIAIPRLGLFISLFGAFCLSMLGVVFPPILDICVHWPDNLGKLRWILIKDILLIIFGLLGFCFGTYTAVYEITKSFFH